ncbi:MAG: hypothetical protein H7A50_15965 [Akkermansiaceae bacterium]|nr:hypothetical protein [Akkermansiaceae bacterium]
MRSWRPRRTKLCANASRNWLRKAPKDLTPDERDEYAGYVRANKFVAVLRREARKSKSGSAA